MSRDPEFEAMLDDLFHGCAVAAYVEEAAIAQGPPESESVRIRAFRYYEETLRKRNAAKGPDSDNRSLPVLESAGGSRP